MAESNVSGLIKSLLCGHYGITASQLHDYLKDMESAGEVAPKYTLQ
jgi:hypothetical protein